MEADIEREPDDGWQPPEWLAREAPDAVPIWRDVHERLARRKLLAAAPPAAISAYAYCLAEALRYERLGPGLTSHVHPGVTTVSVWRRGAQYAANVLGGLFPIVPVSFFGILLDDVWDELTEDGGLVYHHVGKVLFRLDETWEVPGDGEL